ncbi:MAG: ATP-binding cassette domain-containing protein [Sphingopyxis sp.]|uniref:ATP-binding cassette domain-containing protein n=1 Tax=Sphingopyxis sp. TaxID=1908224 RepID=UPI003D80BA57
MSAPIALPAGALFALPHGGPGWRVTRGRIELYLVSAERRRFVELVAAEGQVAPLPAGPRHFAIVALDDCELAPLPAGTFSDGDPGAALDAAFAADAATRDAALIERLGVGGPAAAGDHPLATALAALGAAVGHPVEPEVFRGARMDFQHAPALARLAGLRAGRTILAPGWWRDDGGPLLVEREGGDVAAALWQRGGYRDAAGAALDPGAVRPLCWRIYAPLAGDVSTFRGMAASVAGGIKRELPLIAGAGLGAALLGLIVPLASAWIFDEIVPGGAGGLLIGIGIALALAAIVGTAFTVVRTHAVSRVTGRGQVAMAAGITDRVLRLPARFFKTLSPGDFNQRIEALESIRGLVTSILLSAGLTAFFSLFYLILLFAYEPRMALAGLGVTLVYVAAVAISRVAQAAPLREAAELDGKLAGLTFEILEGLPKLRSAAAEERMLARWRRAYALERAADLRGQRIGVHFGAFADAWGIISLLALFATAALLAAEAVPPGQFIGFLAAFAIFQGSFSGLCDALLAIYTARPLAERARPILTAEVEAAGGRADPGRLTGDIQVSGLSFGYDNAMAPLLTDLSLRVAPGEHVAIVGGSGSGKSTVLRLLLGFEAPATGSIAYDGQELASLDPARLRSQIGVVMQSSQLFAGTILENIRGASDAGLEQCQAAAGAAGLADDLDLMPMGLHTMVTEGAGTLSGGQRQRILIARALAGRPRILFFDEATSALDNTTQAVVAATLDALDASRITIAHRLSTVRNADRICVLERGRFVESGDFSTLMARDGAFAALARRQLLED